MTMRFKSFDSGFVTHINKNLVDEIPQSFLHRNDNFVCNWGEGKWTAEPSISPPAIPYNTCHSERSEESHAASTNFMVDIFGINEYNWIPMCYINLSLAASRSNLELYLNTNSIQTFCLPDFLWPKFLWISFFRTTSNKYTKVKPKLQHLLKYR